MVRSKKLVIVESPAKAKTLARFLGTDYILRASMGHIRDLPKSRLGVDTENSFSPKYVNLRDKSSVIKELKEAVKKTPDVILATDPDREGESIAWHIKEATKTVQARYSRVVFHEITEEAISRAFESPRELNTNLINAQQTRRILDRLVGYKLSPLLWQKVRRGLSAGRVQSVALKIIVDREKEILGFNPVEYWSIEASLQKSSTSESKSFKALLIGKDNKKNIHIPNADTVADIKTDLKNADYKVIKVQVKDSLRQPSPPFITSTLQQEAWRKHKFSAKQTMALAQQLYEGISIGSDGNVGLITYMRTDSINVAQSAILETRNFISEHYGPEFLPKKARVFSKKVKGAQEAHEAIRPTSINREPKSLQKFLTPSQFKVYQLIWQRMAASQMAAAVFNLTNVDIEATRTPSRTDYLFRAQSSINKFLGFTSIYTEGQDEEVKIQSNPLPQLSETEKLELIKLEDEQHFTQPPSRFTEATLIKILEQYGIGRPSTYAPILSIVQTREYVSKQKGIFKPTELGITVSELLVQQFPDIIDTGFSADMETKLDEIAAKGIDWVNVVREFYFTFEKDLKIAEEELEKISLPPEISNEVCPECSKDKLVIKTGRYGKYMECPQCNFRQSFRIKTGVMCPGCPEQAELIGRYNKKGKIFYGCAAFPKHKFAINSRPLPDSCPQCGGLVTEYRSGQKICTNKNCDYKAKLDHDVNNTSV